MSNAPSMGSSIWIMSSFSGNRPDDLAGMTPLCQHHSWSIRVNTGADHLDNVFLMLVLVAMTIKGFAIERMIV